MSSDPSHLTSPAGLLGETGPISRQNSGKCLELIAAMASQTCQYMPSCILSQICGDFATLDDSCIAMGEPESWMRLAKGWRGEAHCLSATGSNDCTHIMQRVGLHQQAAEAFNRSGTFPKHKLLQKTDLYKFEALAASPPSKDITL